ncbi:dihydrolipoyl dehydrogenase family protein [Exiguobacterium artemiae]|uniref:dihydrolipoyl dehydrogenase family protein n=1 Tax=Exiguobacterium artemiae TaxID=340145 RepID=UPI002964D2EA|nr:FAD-dependent oxidoreductase [Exiguobacterium sibiricum]MDW2884718.1 FAD-dependent oxidoreductase [Exiguobacterium sibiricum]
MVVGELTQERDLVILGGGPAGYTAAIRASQLGRTVTLIEQAQIGGLCLNKGCIPSKVVAHAAEVKLQTKHMTALGFSFHTTHDFSQLVEYRERTIRQLRTGVEALCQTNAIEVVHGTASFLADDRIGVELGHQFDTYRFNDVVIATGSHSIEQDAPSVLNAEQLYQLTELPERLVIIGQDYIAIEAAMSFQALGTSVTLIADAFDFDPSLDKELRRLFKKQKIQLVTGTVTAIEAQEDVTVTVVKQGQETTWSAPFLFHSLPRVPHTLELGLERIGVTLAEDGTIPVDPFGQTNRPHIYAIGDVTPGPAIATRAIHEAKRTAEHLGGQSADATVPYYPTIIRSLPPIVSIGLTEQTATDAGHSLRTAQFALNANGATTIEGGSGFIKVISDATTSLILGIHMIGEGAIELAGVFAQTLELHAKEEDVRFPVMPHPSRNEAFTEAVEALLGQAIHLPPRQQDVLTKS